MKALKALSILLSLTISLNIHAEVHISKRKINGPECTSHLVKVLGMSAEEAYQICSSHTEETKICLLQNKSLKKNDLLNKCIIKK